MEVSKRYFFISLQINNTNVWRSRIFNNQTMTPQKTLRNPKCAFSNFDVQSISSLELQIRHLASACAVVTMKTSNQLLPPRMSVLHGWLHLATQVSYAARAAALLPERPQKNMGLGMAEMWLFLVCFFFPFCKKNIPVPSISCMVDLPTIYHENQPNVGKYIIHGLYGKVPLTSSIMRVTLFFVGSFGCFSPTWKVPSEHIWSNSYVKPGLHIVCMDLPESSLGNKIKTNKKLPANHPLLSMKAAGSLFFVSFQRNHDPMIQLSSIKKVDPGHQNIRVSVVIRFFLGFAAVASGGGHLILIYIIVSRITNPLGKCWHHWVLAGLMINQPHIHLR